MVGQNIQVNLQFNANTQNAKAQIRDLQTSLNNLINANASGKLGITPQIQEAVRSAMDLKTALHAATNVDTGKLNLTKFQSELNRSGKSLQQYAQHLQVLGPMGVKTFSQVTQAIAQADTKIFSLQGGMRKLMNTFMNTLRWQATSTAIMGVTSAISGTVSYAKDLDESLNRIQRVTGKSANQMAHFAAEANKAAKSLSTTTKAYTDASLIYYQQGLSDREVKERTDVTTKLANVVGENATTVSEWMTAIWNNFDDGSESLEHYADVLTKLGAATASSADEIAGGLEKFAAVADTIGLSYEYAAAALATITAETRQSEDVVGTALKTIFARMEDLKLGNTLDDGTSLGKYSLALEKIGVNIKDANGELKDMDVILEQTGARWSTLSRDEQTALAQSVAGIRQYAQFMALMDNWDVMQNNLELTEQANGALMEQQRIYEESTKAAENRLKVATEAIKATLLGGDDLTKIYNFGAGALEIVNDLLEAFGGLPTILLAVAAALTKVYQPQIASFFSQTAIAVQDLGARLRHPIKAAKGEIVSTNQQFKLEALQTSKNMLAASSSSGEASASGRLAMAEIETQIALVENSEKLNKSTQQRMEWEMQILRNKKSQVELMEEEVEAARKRQAMSMTQAENRGGTSAEVDTMVRAGQQAGIAKGNLGMMSAKLAQVQSVDMTQMGAQDKTILAKSLEGNLTALKESTAQLGIEFSETGSNNVKALEEAIEQLKNNGSADISELLEKVKQLQQELAGTGKPNATGAIDQAVEQKITNIAGARSTAAQAVGGLDGIDGRTTNINKMAKGIQSVDARKLNKGDQQQLKSLKQRTKALQAERKAIMASNKSEAEKKKLLTDNTKRTKTLGAEINKFSKKIKAGAKSNKEFNDNLKQVAVNSEEVAKNQVAVGEVTEDVESGFQKVGHAAENGGIGFTHWSDKLAAGLSGMTSYMMGLNMLTSAFQSLFNAIGKGDVSLTDIISSLSSMMMGVSMLIPVILVATKAYKDHAIEQQKKVALDATEKGGILAKWAAKKLEIISSKQAKKATKEEADEGKKGIIVKILEGLAGVGKQAGQGPKGWVTAAISLAMLAPIAVAVGASIVGGISGGKQEKAQEDVDAGIESLEAINENQELATSVTDLTKEYNALRSSGESTADVLEDMRQKIPELIDSYKELAKTMETHIDTSELEKAYEVFLKTGDTSLLERAQKKLDDEIKKKEKQTAKSTANTSRSLVIGAASAGDGDQFGNQYQVTIGDAFLSSKADQKTRDILTKTLGKRWNNDADTIQFNATNSGEVIDAYNAMLAARDELIAAGYTEENNDYLREINREIKEMAETMPSLITAQNQLFEIEKEEALLREQSFNAEMGLQQVNSVQDYIKVKDQLIAKLKEEKGWTDAQAEAYLKASKAYGRFAEAEDFFSESGLGFNQHASKQTIAEIQEWFANLPEEDRTLAMTIDYTLVGNVNDAMAALEEARKKAEMAAILQQAEAMDVDSTVFDAYAEGFASVNPGLKQNEVITKQIALNNLKISKGLETLTKDWSKNIAIIQRGNKTSLEYAEAIGSVKKALQEMFGVKPSTEYIEKYSKQINALVNGNFDSIEELQNALAEDYILHMEFKTATNDAWAGTVKDAQSQLRGLLDSIDTSIEIGKDSKLSQTYLDEVQKMLDAGVIAEGQLEEMFRAKGYELNITGWKMMPGPIKTITQTTYPEGKPEEATTTVIEEQEQLKVPIINGKSDGLTTVGTVGAATVKKSTDKRVIDTSAIAEQAKKVKQRRDSLKDEVDRYHEINEVISDTTRELEKLEKAKNKAFGASKLALMDQEIAKQQQLIQNNKQLLQEAKDYYAADRQDLLSTYAVTLDSAGRISNYSDVEAWYLNLLSKYADNEEYYSQVEEQYEAFKNTAQRYEESLRKVKDQAEQLNDELDKLAEQRLEKIEYNVQLKLDMAEDEQAYLDFLMQQIEDDAFAAAEAVNYLGQQAAITLQEIKANEEGLAEIERALAAEEITPDAAIEKLREYRNNLVDLNGELQEIGQAVEDKFTGTFEAWHEEIENGIAVVEHYGTVLSNYKNIIDLVGKDMLGVSDEIMANLSKAQVANANDLIRSVKSQLDANQVTIESLKKARKEALEAGDEESAQAMDELLKIAEEKGIELAETLQGALSAGLQAAIDDFSLMAEQIADRFSEAVSGIYDDIEDMRSGWDRMQEVAERYLNVYEQTYEISKLNRQIQNSIDKTDNITAQVELRDLQQEMYQMTRANQQLSKYDLEYLQKKYDLLVAEQALKDAQNSKTVVRLQKNSEGGLSYVYTADPNTTDQAEQKYEDSLFQYQNFIYTMDQQLTDFFIATQEKMDEEIRAAIEKYGYGTEAFLAAVEKIKENYAEDMNYIVAEYDKMASRNVAINERFSANVATTYNETFLGQIQPDYENFARLYEGTTTSCETATQSLSSAITQLRTTIDKQLELAGGDLAGFGASADQAFVSIQEESQTAAGKVENMATRMENALTGPNGAINAIQDFYKDYNWNMMLVRASTQETIDRVNDLIFAYQTLSSLTGTGVNGQNGTGVDDPSGTGTNQNPSGLTIIGGGPPIVGGEEEEEDPYLGMPALTMVGGSSDSQFANNFNTRVPEGAKFEVLGRNNQGFTIYKKNSDGTIGEPYSYDDPKALNNVSLTRVDDYVHKGSDGKNYITAKDGGGNIFYVPIENLNSAKNAQWLDNPKAYWNSKFYVGQTVKWAESAGHAMQGYTDYNNPGSATRYGINPDNNSTMKIIDIAYDGETYWYQMEVLAFKYPAIGDTGPNETIKLWRIGSELVGLDTGGYTGEWGPEGRMALLHQKEIVLNAHDTENLLTAVDIVRKMVTTLDLNALNISQGLQGLLTMNHTGIIPQALDQNVTITAEFPNATDKEAISEAFGDLINLAAQYASRN